MSDGLITARIASDSTDGPARSIDDLVPFEVSTVNYRLTGAELGADLLEIAEQVVRELPLCRRIGGRLLVALDRLDNPCGPLSVVISAVRTVTTRFERV